MKIEDYLAEGGVLTSPDNAPPRYRAELMRLMASFVDSELAAAAGFAGEINSGPSIAARVAAARIVMEKTANAGRVLEVMGDFGANTGRYLGAHPWAEGLPPEADIGATRRRGDIRTGGVTSPPAGGVDGLVCGRVTGVAGGGRLGWGAGQ